MDDRMFPVPFQQLLLDQIHMGNLRSQLLNIAIIFNIEAIGHHQVCNGRRCLRVLGIHLDLNLIILHLCLPPSNDFRSP